MKLIWFTNNATERTKEFDTIDECINGWIELRKRGDAHWGHVYINNERVWI